MNVLEAIRTQNPTVRARLLSTIRALADGRPLLPWPHLLLKEVALAILAKKARFKAGDRSLDPLLENPSALTEDHLRRNEEFWKEREQQFDNTHNEGRRLLQKFLRDRDMLDEWDGVADFLDRQWATPEHLDTYVQGIWDKLELPEPALVAEVLETETWRLFFEGQGVAAFERGISRQQPRRVDEPDLLQLMYLGGTRRRMIASEDRGTLRAADSVLRGRYENAWAVHISELV